MRSRTVTFIGSILLAAAAALCAGAPAHADGTQALQRLRADLPEPGPTRSIEFSGDVLEQGTWVGTVDFSARASRVGDQPVWRVMERVYTDGQEGEVREQRRLLLGRDLSLLSGSLERTHRGRIASATIAKVEGGYTVRFSERDAKGQGDAQTHTVTTKDAPLSGHCALLFLMAAWEAKPGARIEVPWLHFEATGAADLGRMALEVRGEGRAGTGERAIDTWVVQARRGEGVLAYHLAREGRTLVAIEGTGAGPHVVPAGEGGRRVQVDESAPARTWEAAFLKFGFGYHMAREELIDAAFHWEGFYEHETKVQNRWPADKPLEEFKRAWIDEFVANSKHRSRVDAGRLLDMTLASGTAKPEGERRIVFEAHPTFGGGVKRTYVLECRDGVWGIVSMDF